MSTTFANYSMLTGQRYEHDWYDWCIFASGVRKRSLNPSGG
jgi:hypothetical protein